MCDNQCHGCFHILLWTQFSSKFLVVAVSLFSWWYVRHFMSFAGCSKYLKESTWNQFNKSNYEGYRFNTWANRNEDERKRLAEKCRLLPTNEQKEKFESEHSVQFSELFLLPYFDPVKHHIIYPMHNLMLGVAKHTFYISIAIGLLDAKALEAKVRSW